MIGFQEKLYDGQCVSREWKNGRYRQSCLCTQVQKQLLEQFISSGFEVKVGRHQGSALSPLLFEAISTESGVALPWEQLYADDLVVTAETEEDLIKRLNEWKNNVKNRGMRVNINKTKVMISTERQKPVQKVARWPCGVCGRGVGSNSIHCNSCQNWVHKKCSGIKGSKYKVMKSFICTGCSNPVIIKCRYWCQCKFGGSGYKFCYLDDMLNVDGDADAAVEVRIRIRWNKFRQLVPLLTNIFRDISLISRGRLHSSCV